MSATSVEDLKSPEAGSPVEHEHSRPRAELHPGRATSTHTESELQCVWCGRPDLDCICEEVGCMDLEDQLEELLADDEVGTP